MFDGGKFDQAKIYANTLTEPDKSPIVAHPADFDAVGSQRIIVKDRFWTRLWKKLRKSK